MIIFHSNESRNHLFICRLEQQLLIQMHNKAPDSSACHGYLKWKCQDENVFSLTMLLKQDLLLWCYSSVFCLRSIQRSQEDCSYAQLADANEKFLPFTFIKNKYISNLDKTIRKPITYFQWLILWIWCF